MRNIKLILLLTTFVLILAACTKQEILPLSSEPSSSVIDVAEASTSSDGDTSSKIAEPPIFIEPDSSSVVASDESELEIPPVIQSSSSEVRSKVEQESIIKVASTKSKSVGWSTNDKAIADNLISLLMKYDETSPTLDIKEKDFIIIINQSEKKREYHFWLEFDFESRAIITEVVEEGGWEYHFIPLEESNKLRELFKGYGLSA